jgi:hypothetical protein
MSLNRYHPFRTQSSNIPSFHFSIIRASAADGAHGPTAGVLMVFGIQVVAGGLFGHRLSENVDNIVSGCPGSQRCFDIDFFPGKQTGFDFAVSGQPQAVAGTAKMPADRGDETDFADGARKFAESRRPVGICGRLDFKPVDLMNPFHEFFNRYK